MIGRLKGQVISKQAPDLLLDVQGVGYELLVPLNTFFDIPDVGQTVTLHTHFVVREDAQLLFGFNNKTERALFRELLKANGVGPKLGLAILSGMSAQQFVSCVNNEDATTLVKLPGVGKKTAERLVLEMKDRLKDWGNDLFTPFSDNAVIEPSSDDTLVANNAADDAVSALVALGYKLPQAQKAVKTVNKPDMTTEVLIKEALKSML